MSDFALVCNDEEMKSWMRQFVHDLPPPANLTGEIHVEPGFYPSPAKFPCLVTGFVASSAIAVSAEHTTWSLKVHCRYVYRKQARKLAGQAKTNLPAKLTLPDSQSDATAAKPAKPALAGVLMLSLLLELKEISAVKKHKLLETAEWVNRWLSEQAEVDTDLPGLIEKLWRASEADHK